MKLFRYRNNGSVKPGLVDKENNKGFKVIEMQNKKKAIRTPLFL